MFKKFFIIFSICTFLMFSYNAQRADAFTPFIVAPIVVDGVVVTVAMTATLTAACLIDSGVRLSENNTSDAEIINRISSGLMTTGNAIQNFAIKANEVGQACLTFTQAGIQSLSDLYTSVCGQSLSVSQTFSTGTVGNVGIISIPANTQYRFYTHYVDWNGSTADSATGWESSTTAQTATVSCSKKVNGSFIGWELYILGWRCGSASYYTSISTTLQYLVNGSVVSGSVDKPISSLSSGNNGSVCVDGTLSTGKSIALPLDIPYSDVKVGSSVGTIDIPNVPSVPFGNDYTSIPPILGQVLHDSIPVDTPIDTPIDIPIDTTGTIEADTGIFNIPILGDILKVLRDILSFLKTMIGSLITGLITALKELLTTLFVPDASFVKDRFISLEADLVKKFPVDLTLISDVGKTSDKDMNFIYHFTIFGVYLTLDINFIKQIAPYSRMVANGLVAIFLVWYHFRKTIWLIRGSSPIGGDSHTGQINVSVDSNVKRLN